MLLVFLVLSTSSCRHVKREYNYGPDTAPRAVVNTGLAITLRDQTLSFYHKGQLIEDYPISSSKFGIGGSYGTNKTPLGVHIISSKVGEGQPKGMVFKRSRPTGEIVAVNAPGRDPIVTRVIHLVGLERGNRLSRTRGIFIHGTPEERNIGKPVSYGCIRMKSNDIINLYKYMFPGIPVVIERCSARTYRKAMSNPKHKRIAMPHDIINRMNSRKKKSSSRRRR